MVFSIFSVLPFTFEYRAHIATMCKINISFSHPPSSPWISVFVRACFVLDSKDGYHFIFYLLFPMSLLSLHKHFLNNVWKNYVGKCIPLPPKTFQEKSNSVVFTFFTSFKLFWISNQQYFKIKIKMKQGWQHP